MTQRDAEPKTDVAQLAAWLRGAYGHAFPRVDWKADAGEILDLFGSSTEWRGDAIEAEAATEHRATLDERFRIALRRAVEFAFEDAQQWQAHPVRSAENIPVWPFDAFTDSLLRALQAEHPPVLYEGDSDQEVTP